MIDSRRPPAARPLTVSVNRAVGGVFSAVPAMTVTLTDFGAVTRATGYTVTLTAPSGQVTTNNLPATSRATTLTRASSTVGNYTLRIRATVGSWTGQNLERVLTCP